MSSHEPLSPPAEHDSEPRRSRTRDAIARAAVEIADADGFDAVSMRRIAARLGMGTMSLYHYVESRDDLVALMQDVFMEGYRVPEPALTDDWRSSISAIARATLATLRRHPWALDALRGGDVGPGALAHAEQSMRAVAATGATAAERLEILLMVDDYTIGFALREVNRGAAADDARDWGHSLAELQSQVVVGPYPELRAVWDSHLAAGGAMEDLVQPQQTDERFARGLKRLLDGIALSLPGRQPNT